MLHTMKKVTLTLTAVIEGYFTDTTFSMFLKEAGESQRHLSIVISPIEAETAIRLLQNEKHKRPLTHQLLKNSIKALGAELSHVLIHKFETGIFYAYLALTDVHGKKIHIDSRCSDAVVLAVLSQVPIYATAELMDSACIEIDKDMYKTLSKEAQAEEDAEIDSNEVEAFFKDLREAIDSLDVDIDTSDVDIETLEQELQGAIEEEDYKKAAKLRDMIKDKKQAE